MTKKIKIVWLGHVYFPLSSISEEIELLALPVLDLTVFNWNELIAHIGFIPDVVVLADYSSSPPLVNVESFPCLTIFYAIDTHIHSWYSFYAQSFDLCLVSLKDHLPDFLNKRLTDEQVIWFPPCAGSRAVPLDFDKSSASFKAIFVGNLNPELKPRRATFFRELKSYLPALHLQETGDYPSLYANACLVLNFCDHDDLNFRVFEVLGCKKPLLTPLIKHGLTELFEPEKDFFVYDVNNVQEAVKKINFLLENPELCERVAENGYNKVNAQHRVEHRTRRLLELIKQFLFSKRGEALIKQRLSLKEFIHTAYLQMLYLHLAEKSTVYLQQKAYLNASKKY